MVRFVHVLTSQAIGALGVGRFSAVGNLVPPHGAFLARVARGLIVRIDTDKRTPVYTITALNVGVRCA